MSDAWAELEKQTKAAIARLCDMLKEPVDQIGMVVRADGSMSASLLSSLSGEDALWLVARLHLAAEETSKGIIDAITPILSDCGITVEEFESSVAEAVAHLREHNMTITMAKKQERP